MNIKEVCYDIQNDYINIFFMFSSKGEEGDVFVSVTRCESMETSASSWYWKIIYNNCVWIYILTHSFYKTLSHGTMLCNISRKISYWCKISHGAIHHPRDGCVTSIVYGFPFVMRNVVTASVNCEIYLVLDLICIQRNLDQGQNAIPCVFINGIDFHGLTI